MNNVEFIVNNEFSPGWPICTLDEGGEGKNSVK